MRKTICLIAAAILAACGTKPQEPVETPTLEQKVEQNPCATDQGAYLLPQRPQDLVRDPRVEVFRLDKALKKQLCPSPVGVVDALENTIYIYNPKTQTITTGFVLNQEGHTLVPASVITEKKEFPQKTDALALNLTDLAAESFHYDPAISGATELRVLAIHTEKNLALVKLYDTTLQRFDDVCLPEAFIPNSQENYNVYARKLSANPEILLKDRKIHVQNAQELDPGFAILRATYAGEFEWRPESGQMHTFELGQPYPSVGIVYTSNLKLAGIPVGMHDEQTLAVATVDDIRDLLLEHKTHLFRAYFKEKLTLGHD